MERDRLYPNQGLDRLLTVGEKVLVKVKGNGGEGVDGDINIEGRIDN